MSVWGDAAFLWNPGDGSTDCFDMVTGLSRDPSRFTTGTVVTNDGRTGRSYATNQGDQFGFAADLTETSWSLLLAARVPSGLAIAGPANTVASDQYANVRARSSAGDGAEFRLQGSSSSGSDDWLSIAAGTTSTGWRTSLLTYASTSSSTGTLTLYEGSSTATGSDTLNDASPCQVTSMVIGCIGDSSPVYVSGGEIYACAFWLREVNTVERSKLVSDPFGYLDGGIPRHMFNSLLSLKGKARRSWGYKKS